MRILVTGAQGQLGSDILSVFRNTDDIMGFSKEDWDVTNREQSNEMIHLHHPDVLIHCAAYTNVDMSEKNPELAYLVNVESTRNLSKICQHHGIRFVYISTDYVFNGDSDKGYTEDDFPHPLNVYGRTKRLGEKWAIRCCSNHLIVRTSWLYGQKGNNFVLSILKKANQNEELAVVVDQLGSPTYTLHLAKHLQVLLKTEATGIFHLSNTGSCSWHAFAKTIIEMAGLRVPVKQITSDQLPRMAKRPKCSILRSGQLATVGLPDMPSWESALYEFIHNRGT